MQRREHSTPSWWRRLLERGTGKRPGIFDILVRSGMVNAELAIANRRRLASLLPRAARARHGAARLASYDRTVEAGYHYALRVIGGRSIACSSMCRLV